MSVCCPDLFQRSLYKRRSLECLHPLFLSIAVGPVNKILAIVGSMIGGYAGWWAGAFVGIMTAFILSMVGTGLGVYAGRRMAQHLGV